MEREIRRSSFLKIDGYGIYLLGHRFTGKKAGEEISHKITKGKYPFVWRKIGPFYWFKKLKK